MADAKGDNMSEPWGIAGSVLLRWFLAMFAEPVAQEHQITGILFAMGGDLHEHKAGGGVDASTSRRMLALFVLIPYKGQRHGFELC